MHYITLHYTVLTVQILYIQPQAPPKGLQARSTRSMQGNATRNGSPFPAVKLKCQTTAADRYCSHTRPRAHQARCFFKGNMQAAWDAVQPSRQNGRNLGTNVIIISANGLSNLVRSHSASTRQLVPYRTVPHQYVTIRYHNVPVRYSYGTVPYRYGTVPVRTGTVPYPFASLDISLHNAAHTGGCPNSTALALKTRRLNCL